MGDQPCQLGAEVEVSVSEIFTAQVTGKFSKMLEFCYELMQLVS